MTTTATAPAAPPQPTGAKARPRLIRAELLKIWTTNSWWVVGIAALATTAMALLTNTSQAHFELQFAEENRNQPMPDFRPPPDAGFEGPSEEEIRQMEDSYRRSIDIGRILVTSSANILTSGQFFGLLFIVVLGALVVTNEFHHQTATTTFLATPRRSRVVGAKLVAAVVLAGVFWGVTTVANLAVGSIFFAVEGYSIPLTDWPVVRSVIMNLLAYVVWAVLGVGLGALIRSQLGATITGAAFYMLSYPIAFTFFGMVRTFIIKEDWVMNGIVLVPGVASQIMISPEPIQIGFASGGPPWWTGALVLIGYGVVAGILGTLILRQRDIS
ncbi:MAG TPA: ABC transporter permease subunit [Micromonosporaceae bacterium]|nr:ABC transporter permease subunit [Micromonosporaceae bacterium]